MFLSFLGRFETHPHARHTKRRTASDHLVVLLAKGHTGEGAALNLLVPVLDPLGGADGSVHSQFVLARIVAFVVLAHEELIEAGPAVG